MARRAKRTLDFISFDCVDKTTLKRLHRKYGIEGRLFWFELLRLLGRTENHVLDLSDEMRLEDVLEDELFIDKDTGIKIINSLADWGNIDKKTWYEHKNIWCQSLIDRHEELFKKRRNFPVNPFIKVEIDSAEITGLTELIPNQSNKYGINSINTAESTQIKLNKIKENKIINIYNVFVDEVKSGFHAQWAEETYMRLKIKKGSLTTLLNSFRSHLITSETLHETIPKLKIHLNNWLNKQDQVGKLKEYKRKSVGAL